MNPVRLAVTILVTVTAQSAAYADPVPTYHATQAHMQMGPNRTGENITYTFTGPGLDISGVAGMGCFDWCSGDAIPVDTPVVTTHIDISNFLTVRVGGVSYDPSLGIGFQGSSFFDDFGGLNPLTHAFVGEGPTFTEFNLTLPANGAWALNFAPTTDLDGNPAKFFVDGTFSAETPLPPTPEPGTIGLMLTGSAGIGWLAKRKKTFRVVLTAEGRRRLAAGDVDFLTTGERSRHELTR